MPFSFEERKIIEKGVQMNLDWKSITNLLPKKRSHFSIRNEVRRAGGREKYSAKKAQKQIDERSEKKRKLLSLFAFDPNIKYEGREILYKKSIEERLYSLEEQIKIIWEFIEKKEKNETNN